MSPIRMEFQTADLLPSEFLRLYSISVFFRVEAAALQLSRAHLGFPLTAVFVIDYESPFVRSRPHDASHTPAAKVWALSLERCSHPFFVSLVLTNS
jgi:hypothetical protein